MMKTPEPTCERPGHTADRRPRTSSSHRVNGSADRGLECFSLLFELLLPKYGERNVSDVQNNSCNISDH